MNVFFRNIPVILVFLTLAAFGWLWGGARAEALTSTIPWLYAFLFEALLFFPQRRPYEDALTARRRSWHALRRDPLLYVTLLFVVVLVVPFVNRGLCPVCDYPTILKISETTGLTFEEAAKPPVPFAPFCVNIAEHYGVLLWFLPSLTAMLAAKHALLRQGKRALMEMIVWNAAAMAVLGFVQMGTGAEFPYWTAQKTLPGWGKVPFFSTFGYPNMAGSFFVMMFAFSVGLWQHRVAEVSALPKATQAVSLREQALHRWLRAHYPLIPMTLNFFGALCTLSRAALILLFSLSLAAFAYYECSMLFARHERSRRVKNAAFALGGALLFLLAISVFAPAGLSKELATLSDNAVADRMTGKGQYHVRVATELFKEQPFFGYGGWGYRHFCTTKMTEEELRSVQQVGGANVHNDYMQFLCEHGAVGAGSLFLIFLLLVCPVFSEWYRLYRAARFTKPDKAPPKPRAIYCLPAGAFWILLGDTALIIHAFGDCPMRSAAVLSAFFVSLACAEGYLPREQGGGR